MFKMNFLSLVSDYVAGFGKPEPAFATFNPATANGPLAVKGSLGAVGDIDAGLVLAANLAQYIGWAGVLIALLAVVGLLIFKLVGEESENTMKTFKDGMIKAFIIALLGLLILSAGWFVTFVGKFIGEDNVSVYGGGTSGSGGGSGGVDGGEVWEPPVIPVDDVDPVDDGDGSHPVDAPVDVVDPIVGGDDGVKPIL